MYFWCWLRRSDLMMQAMPFDRASINGRRQMVASKGFARTSVVEKQPRWSSSCPVLRPTSASWCSTEMHKDYAPAFYGLLRVRNGQHVLPVNQPFPISCRAGTAHAVLADKNGASAEPREH